MSIYVEKLNKRTDGSVYVVEEEVPIADGQYEGDLKHDNISNNTIRVFTGPKLTGDEITNIMISVPEDTPWKRHIRIFASTDKVYITYETTGDTVEAEDINLVQESITGLQTHVDTELVKKMDKANAYTKAETDQRIQMVVNAAPEALDTLQEIAQALNNDPNFAATITTQLAGKVDKISGKGLSTEDYTTTEKTKLAGIQAGANAYTHPATHPASIITEDSTHRFTTDTKQSKWDTVDDKVNKSGDAMSGDLDLGSNKLLFSNNEVSVELVEQGDISAYALSIKNDNGYLTIAPLNSGFVHFYTDRAKFAFNRLITLIENAISSYNNDFQLQRANVTKLILKENENESTTNLKAPSFKKTDGTEVSYSGHMHTKSDITDFSHIHDDRYYTEAEIDTKLAGLSPGTGDGDMKKAIYDTDGDGIVDNAEKLEGHPASDFQPAGSYAPSSHTHDDRYYTETEIDTKFSNLDIGNGDMKKSVYDTDGDGVVDEAASVPWTGVNGTDNVITTSDASNGVPKIDGTAASGTSRYYSRADHVHPTDTTRAALASPTFTGTPKAPTATAGTNTTQIATTAFVVTAINNAIGDINTLLDSINGEVI